MELTFQFNDISIFWTYTLGKFLEFLVSSFFVVIFHLLFKFTKHGTKFLFTPTILCTVCVCLGWLVGLVRKERNILKYYPFCKKLKWNNPFSPVYTGWLIHSTQTHTQMSFNLHMILLISVTFGKNRLNGFCENIFFK